MKRPALGALVIVTALLAAACGSSANLSPISPSPSGGGSGATILGSVNGAAAPASAADVSTPASLGSTLTVTVAGTGVSTRVDANGQFTLTNVPGGDIVLQFSGQGVDARVTLSGVGAGDQIQVNVLVSGNSAVVTHENRLKTGHKSEIEGRIDAIQSSERTLTIDDRTISVPTSATIRKGHSPVAFSDLKVGQRVHVKASTEGTKLVATEVVVQNERTGEDDDDQELEGTVSGLTGTCPTISFTVASTSVAASAATDYKHGTCADVKNGVSVEVKALKPASGAWPATRIDIEKND